MFELIWFLVMLIVAFYIAITIVTITYAMFVGAVVFVVEAFKRALKIK